MFALIDRADRWLYEHGVSLPVESVYVAFGSRIAKRRGELDMSQETLGSRLTPGLSRASIANIEKGRQRVLLHSVLELARALELDVADLLDGLDPSPEAVGYENEISTKLADVNPDRVTSLLAKLRDDHE